MGQGFSGPRSDEGSDQSSRFKRLEGDWTPRPDEIDETRSILIYRSKLPVEVIDEILDLAEYWSSDRIDYDRKLTIYNSSKVLIRIDDLFDRLEYFRLVRPIGGSIFEDKNRDEDEDERFDGRRRGLSGKLEKIRWEITSHDQGWSDYPEDHGSFTNSWTWFESSISKTNLSVNKEEEEEEEEEEGSQQEHNQEEWFQICKNFHAVSEFRKQVIVWRKDHPFLKKINQNILDCLTNKPNNHESNGNENEEVEGEDGLRIGIKVRAVAQYPGWTNTVQRIRCQFFYSF